MGGGGGGGGVGKIIIGAVLMVAAIVATVWTGGAASPLVGGVASSFWGAGIGATLASTAFMVGFSIALTGVAMIMQPSLDANVGASAERPENKQSFFLSAPINMVEQGGALPVCFGEFTCGSVTINANMQVYDLI